MEARSPRYPIELLGGNLCCYVKQRGVVQPYAKWSIGHFSGTRRNGEFRETRYETVIRDTPLVEDI